MLLILLLVLLAINLIVITLCEYNKSHPILVSISLVIVALCSIGIAIEAVIVIVNKLMSI